MKRILLIVIGAVLLIGGALGFRLSRELERYTYVDKKGYSRRAREDRFLALRRWTGMNGISLEHDPGAGAEDFDAIIADGGLLGDPVLSPTLPAWVENGGSLTVVLAPRGDDSSDFTTAKKFAAGLGFTMSAEPLPLGQWSTKTDAELEGSGREKRIVSVSQGILIRAAKLPKGSSFVPADEGKGFYFISIPVESGRLTLTGNPVFLENGNLGEADNASLAWELLAAGGKEGRILFLPDKIPGRGFAGNLRVVALLAALASALALGAWAALARRDAMLAPKSPSGRDIGRRLAAEGNFYRSHGRTDGYLLACRTKALRRLRRRGLADKEGRIDADALSRKLNVDPELVIAVFEEEQISGKKGFIKAMKIFHSIEGVI